MWWRRYSSRRRRLNDIIFVHPRCPDRWIFSLLKKKNVHPEPVAGNGIRPVTSVSPRFFFSSFPHRLTLSSVLRSNDGKTLMIGMQGQLWLLTVKEKDLFGCIG